MIGSLLFLVQFSKMMMILLLAKSSCRYWSVFGVELSKCEVNCFLPPPMKLERFCNWSRLRVCVSVSWITAEVISHFRRNDVMTGPTSEHYRLTLVMIQFLIEILNHFSTSLSIVESAILGDLLAFVIQSLTHQPLFTKLSEITDADNLNPLLFGSFCWSSGQSRNPDLNT